MVRSRIALMVTCLSLVSTPGLSAQPGIPTDSLSLFIDYARFRGDESSLYIEFYYSFSPRTITFVERDGKLEGGLEVTLEVSKQESLTFVDRMLIPHELQDTSEAGLSVNLVAISGMQLPEGDYTVLVTGRDTNRPSRFDTTSLPLAIRLIDPASVVLSDIQLASRVAQGSPESMFYKNTLEVIPNATSVFSEDQICYYYMEAYNLLASEDRSDFRVQTIVWDAAKREVFNRMKPRTRNSESSVIVDRIVSGKLPTGTYILGVALLDTAEAVLSSATKKFFVYNSRLGVDSTLMQAKPVGLAHLFSGMDEGDLDREFDRARYEYTEEEVRQYEKLSGVEAKRSFLLEFWERRPAGLRDEYMARVAFVNNEFRVLGREGYRTDRGRVFIVYGPPSDYDRHPYESESRPYEIWYYEHIQGGVQFAFVQRVSNGEYELVHSTHRNELQDDLWFDRYARESR